MHAGSPEHRRAAERRPFTPPEVSVSAALRLPLVDAPLTRADCVDGPRPCERVACRFHLLVESALVTRDRSPAWLRGFRVHPAARGAATLEEALRALPTTCALDVTRSHPDGLTLDETAGLLGVTRERVRQIEAVALVKMEEVARRG
jgi:hypothetical protein